MSPIKNYEMRTKKEFLGADGLETTRRAGSRTTFHARSGAEKIELYRDHRGFHLDATYKEKI